MKLVLVASFHALASRRRVELICSCRSLGGGTRLTLEPFRKRTCYINAGLSHGCDYKDLVGAMAEKSYWDSLSSPGRRRRAAEVASGEYQASGSLELSEEAQ